MSDDEYYGDYDDFEDALWDADPAPDLADDLAEHAAYSPVWQDDPVGELDPYYSDWEYYSDDYYDDDPVLKRTTLDGGLSRQRIKANTDSTKRGRKRKLNDGNEPALHSGKGSLADSIRGTVWAQEQPQELAVFRLGQQTSVALLQNWRELFKSNNGTLPTFGQGQLQQDESWANDLSLADMGLLTERENAERDGPTSFEVDADDEQISQDEDGFSDQNLLDLAAETEPEQVNTSLPQNGVGASRREVPMFDEDTDGGNTTSRKRRRVVGPPSPPSSNKSAGISRVENYDHVRRLSTSNSSTRKLLRSDAETVQGIQNQSLLAKPFDAPVQTAPRRRKRKLSAEPDEVMKGDDSVSSQAGRPIKRIASGGGAVLSLSPDQKLAPTSRMTRSRKLDKT